MNNPKYKQTFVTIVLSCLAVYAHAESNTAANPHGLIGLNAEAAKQYTGRGAKVGVLDSGFFHEHPLFNQKKLHTVKFTLTNPQGKQETFDPSVYEIEQEEDDKGQKRDVYSSHGGQVAGIIGAKPLPGYGYAGGVAQNADLYTASYEAHDASTDLPDELSTSLLLGQSPSIRYARTALAAALEKTAANNLLAINNSWNEDSDSNTARELDGKYRQTATQSRNNPLVGALQKAAGNGTLLVFSAGNESKKQPGALAALPRWLPGLEKQYLSVVAVDSQAKLASYSNHCGVSKNWCVAAPGDLTVLSVEGAETKTKQHTFAEQNGTSYAAPVVTGSLALLKERFNYFTPTQIRDTLLTTATDLGPKGIDEQYGWGLVNAGKALNGPARLLNDETYTVSRNDVWSNTLTAEHTLTKQGSGTLTLAGQNNRIKNISVEAGKLALNGATSADRVTNRAGLAAVGLTVNRRFQSDAGSTLEITGKQGITLQGSGATAQLAGNLAVNENLMQNARAGTTLAEVLTLKNGATYQGGFDQLAAGPLLEKLGLRQDVYFTDNGISVKANENKPFADTQAGAGAQSGLAALNRLRDSKQALRRGIYNSWLQQAVETGNLQNLHYHIGNGIYADNLESLRNRAAGRLNGLGGRLGDYRLLADGGTGVWLEQEHQQHKSRRTDHREQVGTAARHSGLGIAYKVGQNALLAGSLTRIRAETDRAQASSHTRQTELGLALRYMPQPAGWFADISGQAARIAYRQNRRFNNQLLGSGSNSGRLLGGGIRGGYRFENNGWQAEPHIGLQALHLSMKGLNENGELATATAPFKQTDVNLATGLRVKKTFSAGSWHITPHAGFSYIRRLNGGKTTIRSTLSGITVDSTAAAGGKNQTASDLGITVEKSKWFASAAFGRSTPGNSKANHWQAKIGLTF
ncbi:hypothetical protein BWD09_01565 [Neisseria dentiae]|uniref:Autotransporter domain-containing protein n=1 Tax=Neisseria dentiae TaxID=194197 RepID=A0A1X3DEW4_9NEIS|nr:S8 family serine peptidase [Neisseria dentiae]OSI18489.1 hypothetical protein BWD09_01565 [Neisseria dentiae]QMT45623.1 S8 family serine peptidase [Neisseria dentiae]STZ51544.1 extracellular serine protease precursor [Neisseria dentiae]